MRSLLTALIVSALAVSIWADTIELKTGERIDGTFKQATLAGAVIDIAGQPVTVPLERVSAIYFGARPSSPTQSDSSALDALRGLRSVTANGTLTLRDYSPRVLDARVQ